MNIEGGLSTPAKEVESGVKVEIEPGYEAFIPEVFKQGPVEYFESVGVDIKTGAARWTEDEEIRDDPSAVKALPVWTDTNGKKLYTVGKRINPPAGQSEVVGDPFYEYQVMQAVNSVGLPAPKPIVKAEQQGIHLFVMEKVEGVSWYNKDELNLDKKGYSNEDIVELFAQAEAMMNELKKQFDEAGITRIWKLKDMIFDCDFEHKKILKMVPTDWKRTHIDPEKLEAYRKKSMSR